MTGVQAAALERLRGCALDALPPAHRASLIKRLLLEVFIDRTVTVMSDGALRIAPADLGGLGGHLQAACLRHADPAAALRSFEQHGRRLKAVLAGMEAVIEVLPDAKGHMSLGRLRAHVLASAAAKPAAKPAAAAAPAAAGPAVAAAVEAGSPPAAAAKAPARLAVHSVLGVECCVVASLEAARQAVRWLDEHCDEDMALDTEGVLTRDGHIDVLQLFAAGRAYIFDLHATPAADRRRVLGALRGLLESAHIRKVMHDCRADAEALFYLHGIRLRGVWDTQVAHAVLGAIGGMGGADGRDGGSSHRIGMDALLARHGLPPNPQKAAVKARMAGGGWAALWRGPRPLERALLEYAVGDVRSLLKLHAELDYALGEAGGEAVERLSAAHTEWGLDDSDRSYSGGTSSGTSSASGSARAYSAAARLPMGTDMQLLLEAPDYRPRFVVALTPDSPEPAESEAGEAASVAAAQDAALLDCSASSGSSCGGSEYGDENAAGNAAMPGSDDKRASPACLPLRLPDLCSASAEPAAAAAAAAAADCELDAEADSLLALFPQHVRRAVQQACQASGGACASGAQQQQQQQQQQQPHQQGQGRGRRLAELVLDKGRPLVVRFEDGTEADVEGVQLGVEEALERLQAASPHSAALLCSGGRAGLDGTLHRVSAMRGRDGRVLGLTFRVGRHVPGAADLVMDVLAGLAAPRPSKRQPPTASSSGAGGEDSAPPSLLLLGPPGVGTSTLLRDCCGVLSSQFRRRVVAVDAHNDLGGDGDVAHPSLGRARRMMVPPGSEQHTVMEEAVQDHGAEVLVVEGLCSAQDAAAAQAATQRGVALVGAARGASLEALLQDPQLSPLVGCVHQVQQGDGGAATRAERRGAPCFSTLCELLAPSCWRVHVNVGASVDAILAGRRPPTQLRWVCPTTGRLMVRAEGEVAAAAAGGGAALARAAAAKGEQWLLDLISLAACY